ncbi:MAG: glycoside hydrolase family 125 protein [Bacteroidales bacterium]|nr:glycoside hydrolase family 125 protein [Bacteroidales bacterium]
MADRYCSRRRLGNPVDPVGLIVSIFRRRMMQLYGLSSFPRRFVFAVKSLRQMAEIATSVTRDEVLARDAAGLADEVDAALATYARALHPQHGEIIPYETDGYYNYNFMDDANVPSLLGLPYLGTIDRSDPLYLSVQKLCMSRSNFSFSGYSGRVRIFSTG